MRLVIEDEAGTRAEVPIGAGPLLLGRSGDEPGGRLPRRNVSRRHARLVADGGGFLLEDLGSRNGTFVNGERVTGPRRVAPGDLIEIGDYDLVLARDGEEPAGLAGSTTGPVERRSPPGAPPAPAAPPASLAPGPTAAAAPPPARPRLLRLALLAALALLLWLLAGRWPR